jgi:hypothetical protein
MVLKLAERAANVSRVAALALVHTVLDRAVAAAARLEIAASMRLATVEVKFAVRELTPLRIN